MMTSGIFWILTDFVPEYHLPCLVVIGPQKKEKPRGHNVPPAYMIPKDHRLNRANGGSLARKHDQSGTFFIILFLY